MEEFRFLAADGIFPRQFGRAFGKWALSHVVVSWYCLLQGKSPVSGIGRDVITIQKNEKFLIVFAEE